MAMTPEQFAHLMNAMQQQNQQMAQTTAQMVQVMETANRPAEKKDGRIIGKYFNSENFSGDQA